MCCSDKWSKYETFLCDPKTLTKSGYFASHMIYIPQTLAKCAKTPIPGLHRPPGHSTLRSSEHMLHMYREERSLQAIKRRFSCFS